ncbi:nucleotidyltransferase domain-containing protein [Patescibacteria group bacterium AH-259-L07]|nr:nucleotidyltransferase domain-containing protein [Patescibacteria group bacterium AH-259-L07]
MAQKLPQKINKAIKEYIEVLKKDIPIQKVIIYGSYAKGKGRKGSDIDLVIVSDKFGKSPQEEGKYLFRKLWDIENAKIEPIGYSPKDFQTSSPSPLLYEIRKYGKEIKV